MYDAILGYFCSGTSNRVLLLTIAVHNGYCQSTWIVVFGAGLNYVVWVLFLFLNLVLNLFLNPLNPSWVLLYFCIRRCRYFSSAFDAERNVGTWRYFSSSSAHFFHFFSCNAQLPLWVLLFSADFLLQRLLGGQNSGRFATTYGFGTHDESTFAAPISWRLDRACIFRPYFPCRTIHQSLFRTINSFS